MFVCKPKKYTQLFQDHMPGFYSDSTGTTARIEIPYRARASLLALAGCWNSIRSQQSFRNSDSSAGACGVGFPPEFRRHRLSSSLRKHLPTSRRSCVHFSGDQLGQSHQIARRHCQLEQPLGLVDATLPDLPQARRRLQPDKVRLDPSGDLKAHCIAAVPSPVTVDRAAAVARVLCDMRRHPVDRHFATNSVLS